MTVGPRIRVKLEVSCRECSKLSSDYYRIQGDSGYTHLCREAHVAIDNPDATPTWCPLKPPGSFAELTELMGELGRQVEAFKKDPV